MHNVWSSGNFCFSHSSTVCVNEKPQNLLPHFQDEVRYYQDFLISKNYFYLLVCLLKIVYIHNLDIITITAPRCTGFYKLERTDTFLYIFDCSAISYHLPCECDLLHRGKGTGFVQIYLAGIAETSVEN